MFYGIKMKMHTLIGAFGETYLSDFVGYRFERFPCLSFWGSALQVLYSYQSVRPSVHPTSLFASLQSFSALMPPPGYFTHRVPLGRSCCSSLKHSFYIKELRL